MNKIDKVERILNKCLLITIIIFASFSGAYLYDLCVPDILPSDIHCETLFINETINGTLIVSMKFTADFLLVEGYLRIFTPDGYPIKYYVLINSTYVIETDNFFSYFHAPQNDTDKAVFLFFLPSVLDPPLFYFGYIKFIYFFKAQILN